MYPVLTPLDEKCPKQLVPRIQITKRESFLKASPLPPASFGLGRIPYRRMSYRFVKRYGTPDIVITITHIVITINLETSTVRNSIKRYAT